jgi:hypothetical protein
VVGPCFASTARDFFTEVAPFKDDLILPAFAAAEAQPVIEIRGSAGAPNVEPDAGPSIAGTPSSVPGAGAASTDEEPSYGGPRQAGGCKCHLGSARVGLLDPEPLLALMLFGVACGRRRRRSLPSVD